MFERIWKKIIRREKFSLWAVPALCLWLCSFAYRLIVFLNRKFSSTLVHVKKPVISIGNITVGGTGKTTTVMFIAKTLMQEGYRVGIVSRGYGRTKKNDIIEESYKLISRNPSEIGDEVLFLAKHLTDAVFSISESKSQAVKNLDEQFDVDVVIVDDAFQHFNLYRDIDIITYDAAVDDNLMKMFPYGILREPKSSIKRADIIIITRTKFHKNINELKNQIESLNPNADLYLASFAATEIISEKQTLPVKYLEDKSVLIFAGIGNFRAFQRQAQALCADIDEALEFSDHQIYDNKLLKHIKLLADKYDSDLILTTGKDLVKIENFDFGRDLYYLNQVIDLDPGEERLIDKLEKKLNLKKAKS
ncbi:MAG: tetraacyldisaccharide 4'-kinase [Candidatus Zixiibacteriota bacterium]|nr:MAG: tetraacyldisaccharide 4'-kinase [candidate division Zixibacteria bacterium]